MKGTLRPHPHLFPAPADLASVERMILHYKDLCAMLSAAPAEFISVERMIGH